MTDQTLIAPAPSGSDLARRAAALARWRKRSEQVHFFRKALPAAIAAILVFGLGWVGVRSIIGLLSSTAREVGTIHLLNPTFYGRNDKGQLYIMSATEAVRDGSDPDRIALTNPYMRQYDGDPQPMTARALHGIYHEQHKLLDLTGHVVAMDGRGYSFLSETAHVDMPKNMVTGQTPVMGSGPSGTIRADAYAVYDKGQHSIFTGHCLTHLNNTQAKAMLGPSAKTPKATSAPEPPIPAGAIQIPARHPSAAPH